MAAVSELCRQLLIIAGLSLLLDVLLPRGDFRRYTQFIMGMLMVAVLLNPLVAVMGAAEQGGINKNSLAVVEIFADKKYTADFDRDFDFGSDTDIDSDIDSDTEAIIAAGGRVQSVLSVAAEEKLADDLSRQIRSLLLLTDGVADGEVSVKINSGENAREKDGKNDGENAGEDLVMLPDGNNWGRVVIVLTVRADKAAENSGNSDYAENICGSVRRMVADFYGISESLIEVSVAGYERL